MKIRIKRTIHIDVYTIFMLLTCIVVLFYFVPFMSGFLPAFIIFGILCILFFIIFLFSDWRNFRIFLINSLCITLAVIVFMMKEYADQGIVGIYSIALVFFPLFCALFLINKKKYKELKVLSYIALTGLTITAVSTYLGVLLFPEIARTLAAVSDSNTGIIAISTRLNIGGFDIVYCVILALPLYFIVIERFMNGKWIIKKSLKILVTLLIGIFALKTQYTTAVLLLFLSIFFIIIFKRVSIKGMVTVAFLVVILFGSFSDDLAKVLNHMAEAVSSESISMRLEEVADTIDSGAVTGEDITERSKAYEKSVDEFLENPIIGNWHIKEGSALGGHSTVLDLLAHTGSIGGLFIAYAIFKVEKYLLVTTKDDEKWKYIRIFLIDFLVLAVLNPVISGTFFALFFIVPTGLVIDSKEIKCKGENHEKDIMVV